MFTFIGMRNILLFTWLNVYSTTYAPYTRSIDWLENISKFQDVAQATATTNFTYICAMCEVRAFAYTLVPTDSGWKKYARLLDMLHFNIYLSSIRRRQLRNQSTNAGTNACEFERAVCVCVCARLVISFVGKMIQMIDSRLLMANWWNSINEINFNIYAWARTSLTYVWSLCPCLRLCLSDGCVVAHPFHHSTFGTRHYTCQKNTYTHNSAI